jgi:hypothetical protein
MDWVMQGWTFILVLVLDDRVMQGSSIVLTPDLSMNEAYQPGHCFCAEVINECRNEIEGQGTISDTGVVDE